MELIEDHHHESHYHLDQFVSGQNKIFDKILSELKKVLPSGLSIRFNDGYSVNIVDGENRSYLFMTCYMQFNKWRIKFTPFERGMDLFEDIVKPLVKNIDGVD